MGDKNNTKNIIIIIIIVIVILSLCILSYFHGYKNNENNTVEKFIVYSYPKYCSDCSNLSKYACTNCNNCGYCITLDGNGECVQGDSDGPYFRDDCVVYTYKDQNYKANIVYPYVFLSLSQYPYWSRDGYYYDPRGFPVTKYHKVS